MTSKLLSLLYRTSKSNYIQYYANGNGRDKYILYDNAGFYRKSGVRNSFCIVKEDCGSFTYKNNQINKSQNVRAPTFHYYANGTGRDKYILANSGGLCYDTKPLNSYKLIDFLRKDDDYKRLSPIKKKISLSKAEIHYNQMLREKEKQLIKRLYKNEQYKMKLMNKSTFFSSRNEKAIKNIKKIKCLTPRNQMNNLYFSSGEKIKNNNNKINIGKIKKLIFPFVHSKTKKNQSLPEIKNNSFDTSINFTNKKEKKIIKHIY